MATGKNEPLVSICITCFNAEETIRRALISAIGQDYDKKEIIVADDASTDNSIGVLEEFRTAYPELVILKSKINGGVAKTRNKLINLANGEYIVFFDDDDESASDRVSVQLERIQSFQHYFPHKIACCFASGTRIYPNGYEIQLEAIGSICDTEPCGTEIADYLLFNERKKSKFYGTGTPACSLMMRKDAIEQVGLFDVRLRRVEDADLAIRLGIQGACFIGCKEKLFTQYATDGVDKTPYQNYLAEKILVEKFSDYLIKRGAYFYASTWKLIRLHHFSKNRLKFASLVLLLMLRHPLRTISHLFVSGPKRLIHEKRMNQKAKK